MGPPTIAPTEPVVWMQSTFFFALVGLLRTLTLAVVFTRCPTLRVDCAEAATGTERATRQKQERIFFANILRISPLAGPGPSDAECCYNNLRAQDSPNGLKHAATYLKKVKAMECKFEPDALVAVPTSRQRAQTASCVIQHGGIPPVSRLTRRSCSLVRYETIAACPPWPCQSHS